MSRLDVIKEKIAFMTKLFFALIGVIVLVIGGLSTVYIQQEITILFWLGIFAVFLLTLVCILIFREIQKYMNELEDL